MLCSVLQIQTILIRIWILHFNLIQIRFRLFTLIQIQVLLFDKDLDPYCFKEVHKPSKLDFPCQ
jgi:hypothetical protein